MRRKVAVLFAEKETKPGEISLDHHGSHGHGFLNLQLASPVPSLNALPVFHKGVSGLKESASPT
ncbi:unnamed protein product [Arabidopsis halleri]